MEMTLDGSHADAQFERPMLALTASDGLPQTRARPGNFIEACLMVAASTVVGMLIAPQWGSTPVVLLYLPAVLGVAIFRGLWPALFAAVASAMAYNFFFTEPRHTLSMRSAADAVTVTVLFVVALVTSHLAGSMRKQAHLAQAHAKRNATIAGLARRLLSCASEQEIAEVAVGELSRVVNCNVVLVKDPAAPNPLASFPAGTILAPGDLAAASVTLATADPAGRGIQRGILADWQFHPVASQQAVVAVVGVARDDGQAPIAEDQLPLLQNLLDQLALAFERARLERDARALAAFQERDRLRAALLASIGQDVKPRLVELTNAARALRREGAGDRKLISTVSSEASKLDRYIDNLLNLSPASEQEPVQAGSVTIDLYRRLIQREGVEVHLAPKEYAVLAELAKHAGRVLTHAHLLRVVWGPAQEGQIDYLRVAVRSLRQKLEPNPARPTLILNEPAVGYRLATPD